MGSDGNSDVKLSIGKDNELVCVPDGRTWTIDPRGDAYVSAFTPVSRLIYLSIKTGLETL